MSPSILRGLLCKILYWIGFNMVKGIGPVRFRALLNSFGGAQNAWQALVDGLRQAVLGPKHIENLLTVRNSVSLE